MITRWGREDLPDRSYWLLAPLAPGSQADLVTVGLVAFEERKMGKKWEELMIFESLNWEHHECTVKV